MGIRKYISLWIGIIALFLFISSFRDGEPDKSIVGSWDIKSFTIDSNSELLDSILFKKIYDSKLGNARILFLENNMYNFIEKTTLKVKESGKYALKGDSLSLKNNPQLIHVNFIDNNTLALEIATPMDITDYEIRKTLRYRYTNEEIEAIDVGSIRMEKAIYLLTRVKPFGDEE